ncbi:MAG: hypothetical protein RL095_3701 [Verrucomicrobiota bacterium]|jgi:hypothetical protein
MTWTQSAATIGGQAIWRRPALTSIDHESKLVRVAYLEAIKPGDEFIRIGTGEYTISSADPQSTSGQMVAGAEGVIAAQLAKAEPGRD